MNPGRYDFTTHFVFTMASRLLGDRLFLLGNWGTLTCCLDKTMANACPPPSTLTSADSRDKPPSQGSRRAVVCVAVRYPDAGTERNGAATMSPPPGYQAFAFPLSWNQRKTEEANEELPRGRAREAACFEKCRELCANSM